MPRFRYVGHLPNTAAIRHIYQDHDGPVGVYIDDLGKVVLRRATLLVGVRSSLLASTLRTEPGSKHAGPYVDIIAGRRGLTRYLGYHHDGTEPHIIRARRRKMLRFVTEDGRVVFARQVFHPGTRGTRFLTRALRSLG